MTVACSFLAIHQWGPVQINTNLKYNTMPLSCTLDQPHTLKNLHVHELMQMQTQDSDLHEDKNQLADPGAFSSNVQ